MKRGEREDDEREDARRWALIVGVNAAALAAVCIVHRALGAELTLWKYRDTVAFTGSPVFFYKNHNGAYLAASLAVVLGLATMAKEMTRRRIWEGIGLALWVATLAVNSRSPPRHVALEKWPHKTINEMQNEGDKRWDLGWVFTVIAGVLNIMVIYDALAGPAYVVTEPGRAPEE